MGAVRTRAVAGAVVATLTVGLAVGVQVNASAAVDPASALVINEVYGGGGANSGSPAYTRDFVELYNKGTSAVNLSTYSIQYASTTGAAFSGVAPLTGSIAPGGSFLVALGSTGTAGATLPTSDLSGPAGVNLSGTAGAVALASQTTAVSCVPAECSAAAPIVDLVGYGTGTTRFAGAVATAPTSTTVSLSRTNFVNTANNAADFTTGTPSPTAASTTPPTTTTPPTSTTTPPTSTSTPPTTTAPPTTTTPPAPSTVAIAQIQGAGAASPVVGQSVTTTGVVTAAYPTGGFRGFTIQTGGTGPTADLAAPSNGLFVYLGTDAAANPVNVATGQSVSVTGTVSEFNGLTQITATTANVTQLATPLAPVVPAAVGWPTTDAQRESLESVLVQPTGDFTVTNTFNSNNFGEIGLASGTKPLVQPTDAARPGTPEAAAIAADNAARGVALDDGASTNFLSAANQSQTPPYLSLTNPVRVTEAVTFPKPLVVDFRNSVWKLQPTTQVTDTTPLTERANFANNRTAAPAPVGGNLSISSFNVLNYFTTLGSQLTGCSSFKDRAGDPVTVNSCPNNGPRGAFDPADLQRQQDKIVAAINANDAAVTGLMEIENSFVLGEARDEAVGTLVNALNAASTPGKWAFVPSAVADLPPAAEMDVINNAIIYQPALVARTGDARALGSLSGAGEAFDNAREPIAQVFTPTDGGTPFLAVVNHFKSKGSGSGADADQGDGQGASNASRVAQATALRDWVPTITPAGVSDTFLLGDFNSYTEEDPLQVLYTAGYANLAQEGDYSYSFSGLSGSLDHVLANTSAAARVTGSDVWNINSPESVALEYSRYNYNGTLFYAADPFRASDHDPVKVGFTSGAAVPAGPVAINLLNINDFHGRIDPNTVKFAGTIEQLRAAGGADNTLFLSAGDNLGASLYASSSAVDANGNPTPDQPTIDVLNALGLQASALGNHEFDRSQADLDNRIIGSSEDPNALWDYLGANVYEAGTQTPAYPEYATFEVQGLTVAVVGAVTQETESLVSPAGITGLDFGDPVDAVNRVAGELSDGDPANGEADVIVAEYHEGAGAGTPDGATIGGEIAAGGAFAKIATQTSADVDAIFTGHTHKEYVFEGPIPGVTDRTRPIVQTGSYGERIGQIVLTVDGDTGDVQSHTARNVARTTAADDTLIATYPRVAEVDRITDAAIAAAAVTGAVPVGEVSADITRAYSGGSYVDGKYSVAGVANPNRDDRSEESTIGMLVANAVRDATIPSGEVPDIGITNPGGLRADLFFAGSSDTNGDGVVTVAEAVAVQPFANSLFLTTLTGAQLRTVLNQQDQTNANGTIPSRPYLALGLSDNLSFTYDNTLPLGSRITSVTVDGAQVADTDTFRVATNSFLAAGGDNFRELGRGTDPTDTGLIDLDVFVSYVAAQDPASPSFAKRGASVTGLDAAEKAPTAGTSITFDVSDLGLTSLGAPQVTTVRATIGDTVLGDFPVVASTGTPGAGAQQSGTTTVTVTVPAGLSGAQVLTLTANSGTTVTIPLAVTAAPVEEGELFQTRFGAALYVVVDGVPTALTFAQWRDNYDFQPAEVVDAQSYEKHTWSDTLFAVTALPGATVPVVEPISGSQWAAVGFPAAETVALVQNAVVYQWDTNDELFVESPGGETHKLTFGEWQSTGFAEFDTAADQGFIQLAWNGNIGFASDLSEGQGFPITFQEWASADFPTPFVATRFPGDQFTQECGSGVITYAGPTLFKQLTLAEWRAAGSPVPTRPPGC